MSSAWLRASDDVEDDKRKFRRILGSLILLCIACFALAELLTGSCETASPSSRTRAT